MDARGLVSFAFDDGWKTAVERAAPILENAGLRGTFYVMSDPLQCPFDVHSIATVDQIRSLQEKGHEIGCHTVSHPHLPLLSLAEARREIFDSKDQLASRGIRIDTFAYPYGQYTPSTVRLVREAGFIGARSVRTGYNDPSADKLLLRSPSITMGTPFFLVKRWIEKARARNKWLILTWHQIERDRRSLAKQRAFWGATENLFHRVVDYVIQKRVEVVTVREGIRRTFSPQ